MHRTIGNESLIIFNRKHKLKLTLHGLSYWITIFNGFWLAVQEWATAFASAPAPAHTIHHTQHRCQITQPCGIAYRVSGECELRTASKMHIAHRSLQHTRAHCTSTTLKLRCNRNHSSDTANKIRYVRMRRIAERCSHLNPLSIPFSFSADTLHCTSVEIYVRFYAY